MRTTVSLRLSPEARRGLTKTCLALGVSVTALIEALGLELDRNPQVPLGPERGAAVIDEARRIDQERRTRR